MHLFFLLFLNKSLEIINVDLKGIISIQIDHFSKETFHKEQSLQEEV